VNGRLELETERLRVTALNLEALQAWLDADEVRLTNATGAAFDVPVSTPPLFGEDLPEFRDRMAETPDELGWWVWLVSVRADTRAVGVCGLGGRPGNDGSVVLGYSVYPADEGRGYATEAAGALVRWALTQPGVKRVRATVPTWNLGSVAVARKLGMTEVRHEVHPEVGEVAIYETMPSGNGGEGPRG
jgi:RimJ/RimL family protein N-acetyltransferase